ncbi:MAG: hypothetical protein PHX70_13925 [Clostridium sp.]|nr:hypothetical protein [Clostridium sp.]
MFQLMKDGKTNGIVECNPLLGPQLSETVRNIVKGKHVDKFVKSKESVYLPDQAAKELPNRKY